MLHNDSLVSELNVGNAVPLLRFQEKGLILYFVLRKPLSKIARMACLGDSSPQPGIVFPALHICSKYLISDASYTQGKAEFELCIFS